MSLTRRLLSVSLLLAALSTGCGTESGGTSDTPSKGGDEPLTPRALAAVVAEHTGAPSSAKQGRDMEELGRRLVAAVELRYQSDDEDDGDLLAVGVGTHLENTLSSCDEPQAEGLSGCEKIDGGMLSWEGHTPEEDPGVVYVQVSKGTTDVMVFYYGPPITDDPRELDMPVSVEDMLAIGADPRVDVTTSVEAVRAGDTIDFWDNTED